MISSNRRTRINRRLPPMPESLPLVRSSIHAIASSSRLNVIARAKCYFARLGGEGKGRTAWSAQTAQADARPVDAILADARC
jgi:hypothetical protein